jgi:hypothetical protein
LIDVTAPAVIAPMRTIINTPSESCISNVVPFIVLVPAAPAVGVMAVLILQFLDRFIVFIPPLKIRAGYYPALPPVD